MVVNADDFIRFVPLAHASLHYDLPGAVLLLQDVVTDRCLGTLSHTVALA